MMKFTKVVLPTVLAISMIATVSVFAHGGKGGQRGIAPQKKPAVTQKHNHRHHGKKGTMSIKKQTFFTLLVEKYSPETLSAWATTIAESQTLHDSIKSIVTANPELKKTLKSQHTVDLKTKLEETKAIRSEFDAALKAKDAEKTKVSLSKILIQLQNRNQVLATKLAELQKAVAEKAATPTN
jgi:hypothetical protein